MDNDFRKKAIHSLIWSAAQSWGSKMLTFALFVILARLLTPVEFGTAAAGLLVLTLLTVFAEFGFGDAIIQKADLKDEDINLPFFVAMVMSILLGGIVIWQAQAIEDLFGVVGLAPIIVAVAILAPFNTAAMFQEALYKRHTLFKRLALRTLSGTALGGLAACGVAFAGFGVWALVVQIYVMTFVNLFWLWSRPVWKPTRNFIPSTFPSLARFSAPIFGMRVLDFSSVRIADFIVVTMFGTATLGLYTAGSRLYQTIMYLLQSVLSDVGLTLLAKIAHDRARLAALYLNTATTSIALISPIFVMLAALAPEISHVLFGEKWTSVDQIVRPLFLLGAIQCTQFLNGSYFSAAGRPAYLLYLNFLRLIAQIPVFLFCRDGDVFSFVPWFCLAQTVVTIPSYYFVCRVLGANVSELLRRALPLFAASMCGFAAVYFLHPFFVEMITNAFLRGIVLGVIFVATYMLLNAIFARSQFIAVIQFIKKRHSPESQL